MGCIASPGHRPLQVETSEDEVSSFSSVAFSGVVRPSTIEKNGSRLWRRAQRPSALSDQAGRSGLAQLRSTTHGVARSPPPPECRYCAVLIGHH